MDRRAARITMGIPIMSAIATAGVHALGDETPQAVLSGVSTALAVNATMCVAVALVVGVGLRR